MTDACASPEPQRRAKRGGGMSWYKTYVGTASDSKFVVAAGIAGVHPSRAFHVWHAILESAAKAADDGAYSAEARLIAAETHGEVDETKAILDAFGELRMIENSRVVNWTKRQANEAAEAARRERDAERQRRHRDKCKNSVSAPSAGGNIGGTAGAVEGAAEASERHARHANVTAMSQPCHSDVTPLLEEEKEEDIPAAAPPRETTKIASPQDAPSDANIIALPVPDTLERECRELFAGSGAASDRDFGPIRQMLADGSANAADVRAALSDAKDRRLKPKSWFSFGAWVAQAADRSRSARSRAGSGAAAPARDEPMAPGRGSVVAEVEPAIEPAPAPDAAAAAIVTRCSRDLEEAGIGYRIGQSHAPGDAEQALLRARQAALDRALVPATGVEARRLARKLFQPFPEKRGTEAEREALIGDYAEALANEPPWAIEAARRATLRAGEKFRPVASEFLKRAQASAAPTRAELGRIRRLLEAKVYRDRASENRESAAGSGRSAVGMAG